MSTRPTDKVRVESESGSFDLFNGVRILNDITSPAEMSFDLGNARAWPKIRDILAHGKSFKVFLNDRLRMTGRVFSQAIDIDPDRSVGAQLVLRTKLADAQVADADPSTRTENVSIKQFILALYRPLGLTELDFVFGAGAERDIMTGRSSKTSNPPADLEAIKAEQLKVNVGEKIFAAASRVLGRYRMLHWDTPDGKIYVGRPDDVQAPIYSFRQLGGSKAQGTNILSIKRIADWSSIPSFVSIYAGSSAKISPKEPAKGTAKDNDITAAGFYRPLYLQVQGLSNKAQAEARARRELASLSKDKDAFEISLDSWSHWTGYENIPLGVNVTVDMIIDEFGGPVGRYYVYRVECSADAERGKTATVRVVAPGVFSL